MSNDKFQDRYLSFSAEVLGFVSRLPKSQTGKHISDQMFRSGSSVGAHLQEAKAAESRADFIHKLQVALKELREVNYWLKLVAKAKLINDAALPVLERESEELTAMLAKAVITAKRNTR